MPRRLVLLFVPLSLLACTQLDKLPLEGGKDVLSPEALFTTPVAGLERTSATESVRGTNLERVRVIEIRDANPETNATQLTLLNEQPISQGDVLLASIRFRGAAGSQPGRIEALFEKATSPWTKSASRGFTTSRDPQAWRTVFLPIRSAQSYAPSEAMLSLRLAFGPQRIELSRVELKNFGRSKTLDELIDWTATHQPLGNIPIRLDLAKTEQTMLGFGGNFAQPRYGETQPMDSVGNTILQTLKVEHARIGLPLNSWNPEPGVYRDDAQAQASLLALQQIARRKIPTMVSVWEGPLWMLPGRPESGRELPLDRYDDCIESIARYLELARDKYGVEPEYFSFNEPDYGVNFRFTPAQMATFIRMAGDNWRRRGLKTRFVVADTANGTAFAAYAKPLLEDRTIAPYLGPLAFHSWDALSATEASYRAIAELGKQYKKPVWCLEAGHDAQLWQAPNPWGSWDNALRLAMAYERTIRLTRSELMDYWTYQNNYPIVAGNGQPYPSFHVLARMERVFARGAKVSIADVGHDEVQALATVQRKGQVSVLLVNPAGAGTVSLTGLPRNGAWTVWTQTASNPGGAAKRVESNRQGHMKVALPVRSVVTLVPAPPVVR